MFRRGRQFNCRAQDRYVYDFNLCEATPCWAPLRTGQDGPRFGRWANPFSWTILSYADRNVERLDCDSHAEFKDLLEQLAMFHAMNDKWKGIEPAPQGLRDRFIATGAGKLLYPTDTDRHEANAIPLAQAA